MNERIKRLASEAGFLSAGNPEYFHAPRYDGICTEELEEFAKLIIQECINAHVENYGLDIIGDTLHEHFGLTDE
jgi:hypothetical protein